MTKLEKLLNRVDELDRWASPKPWQERMWHGPIDDINIFCSQGPIHPRSSGNLSIVVKDMELIAQYRTLAPLLARQLKVAVEALSMISGREYSGPETYYDRLLVANHQRAENALKQIEDFIGDEHGNP